MPTKLKLADTPEAPLEAAKFGVPSEIHGDDFLFQWHLPVQAETDGGKARAHVTEYYFFDGDRSARRLDSLIREYHPHASARRLSLFEFASGYGCVSRHLHKMTDRYDLVACDIHEKAVEFLAERLGVNAVLSHSDPRQFNPQAKYDIVFALSFFSHMPDRTFGAWIEALFATLADDGLLIFTTHGRVAHDDIGHPALMPCGYWFSPSSEQKDLPTDEYGVMLATPFYVMNRIAGCPRAALLQFQEGFWWGKQDLFIVKKVPIDFRPQLMPNKEILEAELGQLREIVSALQQQITHYEAQTQSLGSDLAGIRQSMSWKVTAPLRALHRRVTTQKTPS